MTTRISIKKTDEVNDRDAMVDILDHDGNVTESHRVSDGEGETEFYIHGSQSLAVREVEKEAAKDDGTNAEAEDNTPDQEETVTVD